METASHNMCSSDNLQPHQGLMIQASLLPVSNPLRASLVAKGHSRCLPDTALAQDSVSGYSSQLVNLAGGHEHTASPAGAQLQSLCALGRACLDERRLVPAQASEHSALASGLQLPTKLHLSQACALLGFLGAVRSCRPCKVCCCVSWCTILTENCRLLTASAPDKLRPIGKGMQDAPSGTPRPQQPTAAPK